MKTRSIAWLPAHPAMGWASMNRCWRALTTELEAAPPQDFRIHCPLPLPATEAPAASRLAQQLVRHVSYPLKIATMGHQDVVHVLDHSFADLFQWLPRSTKKLVTVHDIIPLIDSGDMTCRQVKRFRHRMEWLKNADRVICVSQFTRNTLLEHIDLSSERVVVLMNGASSPVDDLAVSYPRPNMLVVGSSLPRKNLGILPAVLRHLAAQNVRPTVLRVGPALEPPEAIAKDQLVELGNVSDERLSALYRAADLLFFPSTLEGFGLPVIEAMSHGCPVVCANTSSLPEVGAQAALYFDPQDSRAAADQCLRVFQDTTQAQLMKAQGLERAKQLSWAQHWTGLCDIYREVLHHD